MFVPLDVTVLGDLTYTSFVQKFSWGPHQEDWGHLDLWSDGGPRPTSVDLFSRDFQVTCAVKKNASVNGPVDAWSENGWRSRCGRTIQPSRRLEQTLEFAPVSFLVLYLHEHVFLAKKMIRRPKKVSYLDTWASPCVFAVKVIQPCNT